MRCFLILLFFTNWLHIKFKYINIIINLFYFKIDHEYFYICLCIFALHIYRSDN